MKVRGTKSVGGLLEERARHLGDRVYLVFEDREVTFAQMNARVDRVAYGLRTLGVSRGDRVALLLENGPDFLYAWWAVLKLGAVAVPVNLGLAEPEVTHIVNHCGARAVVAGETARASWRGLRGACPGVEHWLAAGEGGADDEPCLEEFLRRPSAPVPTTAGFEDPAVFLYTSGTTGRPKAVVHTHGNYLWTAAAFANTVGLEPSDRLLTANPLFHINAQFYSAMGTLAAGATFVLARKFSASRLWEWTRRYRANKVVLLLALTTILYNRPAAEDDGDNPVEVVVAGGAPRGCYRAFEERFGVRLQTLYSLTESPIALMGPAAGPCREQGVGVPMELTEAGAHNEVRIIGEDGREVSAGHTGQIVIRNPAVMNGYYRAPEATAETLKDGWLQTGDLGRRDPDGYFFFLGRGKDVIRRKGENISAAEVEAVLLDHPAVAECAVVGVATEDALGEEEIKAFVVWGGEGPAPWGELVGHCTRRLAQFKIPRYWQALPALPKNAMNRVVKRELKTTDACGLSPETHDHQRGNTRGNV